jgi:hypothetical protein
MSDSRNENSDYVRFVLQYENETTLILSKSPEGWDDDALEIVRNTKYHGITTQFTGGLKFTKDAKDYINSSYAKGGINGNMYLVKYTLRKNVVYNVLSFSSNNVPDIAWEERYRGVGDFKTLKEKDNKVELNFKSDQLEDVIKSHESDNFELNRKESIGYTGFNLDGDLSFFGQQKMTIKGRDISAKGKSINLNTSEEGILRPDNSVGNGHTWREFSIPTQFVTKGFDRHVEVNYMYYDYSDFLGMQSIFFYNDSLNRLLYARTTLKVTVSNLSLSFLDDTFPFELSEQNLHLVAQRWEFDESSSKYIKDGSWVLNQTSFDMTQPIDFYKEINLTALEENDYKTAWSLNFVMTRPNGASYGSDDFKIRYTLPSNGFKTEVNNIDYYQDYGTTYRFSHLNDIGSRLLEIMTGEKRKFYSKFLGRNIDGYPSPASGAVPIYQDYEYANTGEAGNTGVIHGLALRNFTKNNLLYKSITTSFKDYIKSLQSIFNIGLGTESSRYGQRVRLEKLEYFYQDSVSVTLPNQVTDVSRLVNAKMFISSVKIGATKGGEYKLGTGLDEPNIKAEYILPLMKTDLKYEKTTKYRSDDVGMEELRRQIWWLNEQEDANGDDNIWMLDLKDYTILDNEVIYEQLDWQDALAQVPTGIDNPDSYRSWRFTPKRCFMRHEWVLRAGMEHSVYMNNKVSLTSKNANINLSTQYIGESAAVSEKDAVIVGDMERPRLLPEIIKFTHPINDTLLDLILGKTTVSIGGENEEVPNWYFQFQWINEKGEKERGYLKSFKPKKDEFEFYKANEKRIFN